MADVRNGRHVTWAFRGTSSILTTQRGAPQGEGEKTDT
jgi:hypothetical protein